MLGLCWFINGFMFLPLMNLCRIIIISSLSVLLINVQLSIQSKIMASGLITSWQIEGEKVEAVTDFIFLGSKITADSDCSHKAMINLESVLKKQKHHFTANRIGKSRSSDRFYFLTSQNHCRWWLQPQNQKTLAPWKKSCDQPRQCIEKQGHLFANKGLYGQSYGFSSSHVWMWELDHNEGWVPKNRCFQTVVLEQTLEVPWIARSNQSILREINPEYSLEGLMLKLQYFGHLMQRASSLEKYLMLGKIEGKRKRGGQRIRLVR